MTTLGGDVVRFGKYQLDRIHGLRRNSTEHFASTLKYLLRRGFGPAALME